MTNHCSSWGQPTLSLAQISSVLCSPSSIVSNSGGNGAAVWGCSWPSGAEGDLEKRGFVAPRVDRPPLECSLSMPSVPDPMSGDILRLVNCGEAARRVGRGVGIPAYPMFSSGARLTGGGPVVLVLPARKGRVIRDVVANLVVSCVDRFRNCSNDNSAALALLTGRDIASAGLIATISAPADVIVGNASCRRPLAREWSVSGRMICTDCEESEWPLCLPVGNGCVTSTVGPGCATGWGSRTGQRCTRRRNPYVERRFKRIRSDKLAIRTLTTPKLVKRRTSMPILSTSNSCIHSKTVLPGLSREYKCNSTGQSLTL